MLKKLPDLIDPIYAAKNNMQFDACVEQGSMARLASEVLDPKALVKVEINFSINPSLRTPSFNMKVSTCFTLLCQTSLESFSLEVEEEVQGVFVETMALAEDLDDFWEVYELSDEKISLLDLVEDELLLAIPMVPRQVGVVAERMDFNDFEMEEADTNKANPFQDLKKLLH